MVAEIAVKNAVKMELVFVLLYKNAQRGIDGETKSCYHLYKVSGNVPGNVSGNVFENLFTEEMRCGG